MKPEFNFVKKGYNPIEVDEYIQELEHVIKSYKDKDNAIKNALINAEIASDNIIKNAKLNAAQIKYNAEEEANKLKSTTQREHNKILASANTALDNIVSSINEQKSILTSFQAEYEVIINKYLKNIQTEEYKAAFDKIASLEAYILNLKVKEQADDLVLHKISPLDALDINSIDSLIPFVDKTEAEQAKGTPVAKEKVEGRELKAQEEIIVKREPEVKREVEVRKEPEVKKEPEKENPLDLLLSKENVKLFSLDDVEDEDFTEEDAKKIGEKLPTHSKAKSEIIAELQKASSVASTIYDSKPQNQSQEDTSKEKGDLGKHNLW